MKKFLSCVLAMALVFSLMSMTVWASEPNLADDQVTNIAQDNTKYNVIGNGASGNSTENGTYTDGVTDFQDKKVGAEVGVSFEYVTTTENNGGTSTSNTVNVIQHRYAIDIEYSNLTLDLGQIVKTTTETEGDTTTTTTYKFEWNVNTHKYDMVATTTVGNETTSKVITDKTEYDNLAGEVVIEEAFNIINHSDLAVYYQTKIEVASNYVSVLDLKVDGSDAANTIEACIATVGTDGSGATTVQGTEQATGWKKIVASPSGEMTWADTIGVLAANSNAGANEIVVGTVTITVSSDNTILPAT